MAIGAARQPDGRTTRWAGHRARRTAELVDAALAAIADHGPEVSTEQIAAQAGVARTRLYRYFADAEDLRRAIAARAAQLVSAELEAVFSTEGSPMTIIETVLGTHIKWLTEHRNLYRYLLRTNESAVGGATFTDVKTALAEQLTTLLAGYMTVLEIDPTIAETLGFGLVGLVESATSRWIDQSSATDRDRITAQLARWIWAMLDDTLRESGVHLDPNAPLPGLGH
jgi:AcrR family transcriptional regulator